MARTTVSPRELKLTILQVALAAVIATAIGLVIEHSLPLFAPLTAITLIQVLCAPHRRGLWLFLFGEVNGALAATMFIPNFSTRHAFLNALIGAAVAFGVAYATTPRNPVRQVNDAIEPVLSRLAINTRAIAAALRSGDTSSAGAAVYSLNDVEPELNRLNDVLNQVRRSALLHPPEPAEPCRIRQHRAGDRLRGPGHPHAGTPRMVGRAAHR